MGHGIARLSPSFCCDRMRFRNLGSTEATFWDRNIVQQPDTRYLPEADEQRRNINEESSSFNSQLRGYGVSDDVCRDALNPGESFQSFYIKSPEGSVMRLSMHLQIQVRIQIWMGA